MLLESASEGEPRGVYSVTADDIADVLHCETSDIDAVLACMQDAGMIAGSSIQAWEKRQAARDDSAARQRKKRERDADVTRTPRDSNAHVTRQDLDTDTDKKERTPSLSPKGDGVSADFDAWWQEAPRKVGRGQALKAYSASRKRADAETLLAGIQRYAASCRAKGTEPQFIAHPATWLNGDRWLDEDAPPKPTASAAAPRIETYDDREAREAKRLAEGVAALKAGRPPPVGWSKIDTSRAFSRGLIDTVQAERAGLPISIRTPAQQAGAE
jgi:hypothetical protein